MITHAVLCPGPPLLAPQLSDDPEAVRLRTTALDAVRGLLADDPDVVVVLGTSDRAADWPSAARANLHTYGAPVAPPPAVAPLSVGIGAMLLDLAGYPGELRLQTVHTAPSTAECVAMAAAMNASGARAGMIVVADGSARRTLKAPGYLDPRAEPYDAAVSQAVASGWAALQVLAEVFAGRRPRTTVHYDEAPYGVGYLIASIAT